MATSASRDFTLNRNQIIQEAYEDAGVYGAGETIGPADNDKAIRKLNTMIKAWVAKGVGLWNRREATLFLADSTGSYNLSNASSSAHCTNSYVSTTISANEASGQTVLSLTSTTGMTAADNIGIELDDGTRQWTTISSVDSSTQVTVAVALTGAAASGNTVVSYTSRINRPLRITNARRYHLTDDVDVPIELVRHDDYFELSKKTQEGTVTQAYYDKQLTTGVLYVYPEPDGVKNVLKFTYHDMVEDFDASTDNADFPEEWLEAIIANLAWRLAPKTYPQEVLDRLERFAKETFETASMFDVDDESFMMSPESQ